MRADAALVARGLAASRTLAQRLIAAGSVRVDDGRGARVVARPSEPVADDVRLTVDAADPVLRYVSRGGLKLEAALARLRELAPGAIDPVAGRVALDVGLSTGGFADCLLAHGAARVVGVDVGHGQLHPRLAADPRLRAFDGVNARTLGAAALGDAMPEGGFGIVSIDVSFIALGHVLPAVVPLLAPAGWLVALVKPQFELGPQARDRHGVVRDAALYPPLLARLADECACLGCTVRDTIDSPIAGGDGNREFLMIAHRAEGPGARDDGAAR